MTRPQACFPQAYTIYLSTFGNQWKELKVKTDSSNLQNAELSGKLPPPNPKMTSEPPFPNITSAPSVPKIHSFSGVPMYIMLLRSSMKTSWTTQTTTAVPQILYICMSIASNCITSTEK